MDKRLKERILQQNIFIDELHSTIDNQTKIIDELTEQIKTLQLKQRASISQKEYIIKAQRKGCEGEYAVLKRFNTLACFVFYLTDEFIPNREKYNYWIEII